MGRVLVYFGRFALIFLGYVSASLAASAFLNLLFLGMELTSEGGRQFVLGPLLFSIAAVGLIISYFAFLPSVPAILMSETFGWRDWLYYAVAGAVVATIAIFLVGAISPPNSQAEYHAPWFWAAMVGGGMVGGIAYWLVAGRLAGNWRARARPEVSENA